MGAWYTTEGTREGPEGQSECEKHERRPPSTLGKEGLDMIAHTITDFIAIFGMWQVSNLRPLPPSIP